MYFVHCPNIYVAKNIRLSLLNAVWISPHKMDAPNIKLEINIFKEGQVFAKFDLVWHRIITTGQPVWTNLTAIIIIIISCWQHGYPWPSLATPPYRSSPWHRIITTGQPVWTNLTAIIIIIISCWQHGYPWPSLATPPYRSSPWHRIITTGQPVWTNLTAIVKGIWD